MRFASVYRSFQDVEAFRDEVERLRHRRRREGSADQLSLLPGSGAQAAPAVKTRKADSCHSARFDQRCMRARLSLPNAGSTPLIPTLAFGSVVARKARRSVARAGTSALVRRMPRSWRCMLPVGRVVAQIST